MNDGAGRRKSGKSGRPKDSLKSKVESPKSEKENNSDFDSNRDDIPRTEIETKSEIENTKSEIKEMEVHHHPEVAKKGLKEYVLEGLMIFLAVMMGFFAESLQEHISDQSRETEYMRSMVQDLKSDTAALVAFVKFDKGDIKSTDSLIADLYASDRAKKGNDIYYFARKMSIPYQIIFNDRTRQQLKSSGSLRLISNVQVSNGIMAYDQKLRVAEFEMTEIEPLRQTYRDQAAKVFDMRTFDDMLRDGRINKPVDNPQLFVNDPALINSIVGSLQYLKNAYIIQSGRAGQLLIQAKELIKMINKEYKLDDE
jgi:hypothetical protein